VRSLPTESHGTRLGFRLILLLVGAIIALVIVVVAGLYYLQTQGTPSALETHVSVSPMVATSGENVAVTIWDNNTLAENNHVAVASDWAITGLSDNGCVSGWPLAIGLLKGNYMASNVSQGQLVQYPFSWSCPAAQIVLQSLTFLPHNSTAIAKTNFGTPTWNILQVYTYQNLEPGAYTVVACDEWGHLTLAYFSVTA
jgi:hypothetical protein